MPKKPKPKIKCVYNITNVWAARILFRKILTLNANIKINLSVL